MLYEEDDYLKGLVTHSNLENKVWFLRYTDLYQSTLNWPEGLPPIARSNLVKGTLREKFYSTYHAALSTFDYNLDNEKQTLAIF